MIKNRENGRSMIEMLGVLAVVGVLSVGGISGYSKAMHKYKLNKTIEQVTNLSQNIRTFFANQKGSGKYKVLSVSSNCFSGGILTSAGSPSCTGAQIVKKARLIPDEMYGSGDSGLEHAFGGDLEIAEEGDGLRFRIVLSKIPPEACIELVTQNWEKVSAGIFMIRVLGIQSDKFFCASGREGCGSYFPIEIDQATNACNRQSGNMIQLFYE